MWKRIIDYLIDWDEDIEIVPHWFLWKCFTILKAKIYGWPFDRRIDWLYCWEKNSFTWKHFFRKNIRTWECAIDCLIFRLSIRKNSLYIRASLRKGFSEKISWMWEWAIDCLIFRLSIRKNSLCIRASLRKCFFFKISWMWEWAIDCLIGTEKNRRIFLDLPYDCGWCITWSQ